MRRCAGSRTTGWRSRSRILAAFIAGHRQLPDGGVLVTIDDGYRSTFEIARPILERHRIPAVAFVTAGLMGRHVPGDHEPFMSWEQVRGLLDAGLSVGSHAYTHSSFGQMSAEEAYDEGKRSRETLERELGRPVTAFAYPFGTAAHHSAVSARVLAEECGYRMLFLSEHGPIGVGSDPRLLKRVKIESGEPQWMFELACRGALDPWVFVDRGFRLRPAA